MEDSLNRSSHCDLSVPSTTLIQKKIFKQIRRNGLQYVQTDGDEGQGNTKACPSRTKVRDYCDNVRPTINDKNSSLMLRFEHIKSLGSYTTQVFQPYNLEFTCWRAVGLHLLVHCMGIRCLLFRLNRFWGTFNGAGKRFYAKLLLLFCLSVRFG